MASQTDSSVAVVLSDASTETVNPGYMDTLSICTGTETIPFSRA